MAPILRPGYSNLPPPDFSSSEPSYFQQRPAYTQQQQSNQYDIDSIIKSLNLPLDAGSQDYLFSVFLTMFQTLALSVISMGVTMYYEPHIWNRYTTVFGVINFIAFAWLMLFSAPHQHFLNIPLPKLLLSIVGITTGISLKPVIEMVSYQMDYTIPFMALVCTTVSFLFLAYFSLKQTRGYLISLWSSFATILSLVSMYSLVSMLFNVHALPAFLYSLFGVVLISFTICFDIQTIVHNYQSSRYRNDPPNVEKDAVMLFVNFIQLFVRILAILQRFTADTKKREQQRHRRREL